MNDDSVFRKILFPANIAPKVQLPEGVTPFIHITQNEFLWRKHKKLREEDIAVCECKYDASDPNSACVGRCLNVLTNIECTPGYCRCDETCRNQRFQKREYAKTKLFRTEGRGWGLLADENIKAGQFIIECCGEVISFEEAKKRSQAYEFHELKDAYIISLDAHYFIDATRKGNFARFINHSCQPNCETTKWIVSGETRVGIFAKQDISVGMELTYNYNFEWYGGATVHCLCGAANCSIFLGAKNQRFREYNHVWEDGDDRYMVEDVPLYDSADDDRYIVEDVPLYDSAEDESFLVISGTSGGSEHTKILNDSEGSTFKLEPSNSTCKSYNIGYGSTTKKKSQRIPKLKVQLPEGVTPFVHITQNEFLGRKHKKLKEEDVAVCECKYDVSDPETACGERCLNVLTSTECTLGYCNCGENCRNQRFQKREYAKTKLFRTEGRGWGILADENIKAGQFIMEYCGEVLSSEAAKKRSLAYEAHELKDAYIISLNANYFIDATQKGSLARFINHSCQPNCETRKWIVLGETRIGIFAKQDISVGMELSYNYNFEWYGGATVRCLCGAANCSIFLGAKSQGFKEYNHVWEEGDNRYIVEDVPLYDSEEDESFPVISGTSGGNEHTKILNDSEGSTFKLEPSNSTCKNYNSGYGSTTKKSQRKSKLKRLKMADPGWNYGKRLSESNRTAVVCNFCEKVTNGGIFRHKQHIIGTYRDVSRCEKCPKAVREEIKKYVDDKKELKRQSLFQSSVTNIDDDEDEEMEEGEAADLSFSSKSQKQS